MGGGGGGEGEVVKDNLCAFWGISMTFYFCISVSRSTGGKDQSAYTTYSREGLKEGG